MRVKRVWKQEKWRELTYLCIAGTRIMRTLVVVVVCLVRWNALRHKPI